MAFHEPPLDIAVEVFVNDDWETIPPGHIYQDQGIEISGGRSREGVALPDPSEALFTVDNTSGDYDPDNVMGQWWPSLRLNTPIRICRGLDSTSFPGSAASGWVNTDAGHVWSTYSDGGVISGTDYSVTGGVGKHSVPAANATRMTYLDGEDYRVVEVAAALQLSVVTVTGGSVGGQICLRGQSTTSFYKARCTVLGTTVVASIRDPSDTLLATVDMTWAHTGQKIRMRAQVESETIRLRLWQDGTPEPYAWSVQVHNSSITVAGFVGLQTFVSTGNSNTKPIIASWDDVEIRSPRFFGEISSYAPGWDVTGDHAFVAIRAQDVLGRLTKSGQLQSTLRRGLGNSPNLRAYWPCEEDDRATGLASVIPGHDPVSITGMPDFAAYTGFDASLPIPTLKLSGWTTWIPYYPSTGEIQVTWLMHIPAGGTVDGAIMAQAYTAGTAGLWEVIYGTGGTVSLRVFNNVGVVAATYGPFAFDLNDHDVRFFLMLTQDGADVDWTITAPQAGELGAPGSNSGTLSGHTIGNCFSIRFGVGLIMDDVAIGHIALHDAVGSPADLVFELAAWTGERSGERAQRMLEEEGHTVGYIGDLTGTEPMGIQDNTTLTDNLDQCVATEQGTLRAARGALELIFQTRTSMYSQDPAVSLDLSAGELAEPFAPVRDPDTVTNYVTVKSVHGGSAIAVLETGALSIQAPPDGIGKYDDPTTVNTESDSQLQFIADWLLAQYTVNDRRFPALGVDLANQAVSADAVLSRQILDVEIDNRLEVVNAQNRNIYENISQLARGYRENLSAFEHHFTYVTIPESPYAVAVLDDTSYRLDSDSVLENAITSGQTSFTVQVNDTALWTEVGGDVPFDVIIGGERMTVTAISSTAPTFISAGTAAHADNASVSPGLPAGAGTGDALLIFANARDFAASLAVSGYTQLVSLANNTLWGKIHSGSEVAPTVTVSGGSAGNTVSAQMCAFNDLPISVVRATAQSFNGSAQNIDFPAMGSMIGEGMLLHCGWKQDDFTSVATLTGATEIGEFSSTLGSDQGSVWDYRHVRGEVVSAAQSFVVTGGASAFSRGMTFLFGSWQTFTVTRAVNGAVKAHAAGTAVRVARPFKPGL